jgi:hypothetical protein
MSTIRDTTALHPDTVRANASAPTTRWRPRRRRGAWVHLPETIAQIDPALLARALETADGNRALLWFDKDERSVWILNHTRMTTCISPACPACQGRGHRSA